MIIEGVGSSRGVLIIEGCGIIKGCGDAFA